MLVQPVSGYTTNTAEESRSNSQAFTQPWLGALNPHLQEGRVICCPSLGSFCVREGTKLATPSRTTAAARGELRAENHTSSQFQYENGLWGFVLLGWWENMEGSLKCCEKQHSAKCQITWIRKRALFLYFYREDVVSSMPTENNVHFENSGFELIFLKWEPKPQET